MNELALFAGAGGGILAGKLLGWRCVCAVEWEPYAACVLAARQNEGVLPPFPIWSDVRTFDGRAWRGAVDVVSGGFPCQDISVAGKGAGIDGERSGMWQHMARIIGEVRPRFAFVENSPALLTRGLDRVLADLAALGYDCRWTVLGAADVGAPHQRDRFWLVAADAMHSGHGFDVQPLGQRWGSVAANAGGDGEVRSVADADCERELQPGGTECQERGRVGDCGGQVADTDEGRRGRRSWAPGEQTGCAEPSHGGDGAHAKHCGCEGRDPATRDRFTSAVGSPSWWEAEPDVGRVADGVAHRVDRLKALGNGQVPLCAATAWRMLTGGMNEHA